MVALHSRTYRSTVTSATLLVLAAACAAKGPPPRGGGSLPSSAGHISEILDRERMTMKVTSMEELIRHRIPGVLVRRAGSRTWIEIRGPGTIASSTEALIIVDGVQNTSHGLLGMDPTSVERIQVLKDGSAAIYGMRAANGVVVVTTRR